MTHKTKRIGFILGVMAIGLGLIALVAGLVLGVDGMVYLSSASSIFVGILACAMSRWNGKKSTF